MNKLKNLGIAVIISIAAISCFFLIPIVITVGVFIASICFTGFCIYGVYLFLETEDPPVNQIETKEEEDT